MPKPEIKVRIAFIDAPEKGQAFDQRAKQAMSELVFGKDVVLQPHTIDRQDAAPVPPWEWRKEKLTSMQSASLL